MSSFLPSQIARLIDTERQTNSGVRIGTPRLSVVIVNYRQWERTADLVRQIQDTACFRQGQVEVVIIDNHSPNHPIIKKLRRLPNVSLRRWNRNHGFAKAVNEGCRLSQGDWFLLMNPDTTLTEGFLEGVLNLGESLEREESRAGIVGFHLRNSDGSQQFSAGPFPTLFSTLSRLVLPREKRKYHALRDTERRTVPWVTGCCVLLKRACLEEIGGVDEDYFLYYEDVDLCLKAKKKNWTVSYEPNLAIIHHDPLHQRRVPAVLRLITRHSLMTYARKHWPLWQFWVLQHIIRWEAWVRQGWSWWQGDVQQMSHFRELRALARDLMMGDQATARRRICEAIRRIDVRVGV